MKFKYTILILSSLLVFSNQAGAQDYKPDNLIVFINPQYMVTNGIRVDIDYRKQDSNKWWIISPYFYSDASGTSYLNGNINSDLQLNQYKNMYGLGLGIARKIFLKTKTKATGFYGKVGLGYKYFNISNNNLTYVEETGTDGLPYIVLREMDYTININNLNAYAALGRQFNILTYFYIDLYIGFGLKYSMHNSPENVKVKYNRGDIDYGYTGTLMIAGARLGITL